MPRCSVCGNDYQHTFEIKMNQHTYIFDCFECAIHQLAPTCQCCGCRIIGHGIEADEQYYCCANCARAQGIKEARDHV